VRRTAGCQVWIFRPGYHQPNTSSVRNPDGKAGCSSIAGAPSIGPLRWVGKHEPNTNLVRNLAGMHEPQTPRCRTLPTTASYSATAGYREPHLIGQLTRPLPSRSDRRTLTYACILASRSSMKFNTSASGIMEVWASQTPVAVVRKDHVQHKCLSFGGKLGRLSIVRSAKAAPIWMCPSSIPSTVYSNPLPAQLAYFTNVCRITPVISRSHQAAVVGATRRQYTN